VEALDAGIAVEALDAGIAVEALDAGIAVEALNGEAEALVFPAAAVRVDEAATGGEDLTAAGVAPD